MITGITITGADDSIDPSDIIYLSDHYPFVEWGILVSKTHFSTDNVQPRFPSMQWITQLCSFRDTFNKPAKLSIHVCGNWIKTTLMGDLSALSQLRTFGLIQNARRIQLNTHGITYSFSHDFFIHASRMFPLHEFIFQYDGENNDLPMAALNRKMNFSILYDCSHGAGLLPVRWPEYHPIFKCGYAGGLSPENLTDNIIKINQIIGSKPVWIDLETHVRSENDRVFDLDKVESCLKQLKPFIQTVPAE